MPDLSQASLDPGRGSPCSSPAESSQALSLFIVLRSGYASLVCCARVIEGILLVLWPVDLADGLIGRGELPCAILDVVAQARVPCQVESPYSSRTAIWFALGWIFHQ